jgi:hypothetical protein
MALASVFEEILKSRSSWAQAPRTKDQQDLLDRSPLSRASGMTIKCGLNRSREMNRWIARRELAEKILERTQSELSTRRQAVEKIRRQKRRRSRRQKARMLDEKRKHGEKKAARARVDPV